MEILDWNADRGRYYPGRLDFFYFGSNDRNNLAVFQFDRSPPWGVRPYHLIVWAFPPHHFFSRSPALYNALMRVLYEPD